MSALPPLRERTEVEQAAATAVMSAFEDALDRFCVALDQRVGEIADAVVLDAIRHHASDDFADAWKAWIS